MHQTSEPPLILNRGEWAVALAASVLWAGCDSTRTRADDDRSQESAVWFEARPSSGIDFRHRSGDHQEFAIPSIMGGGGALLDYDNDGDLDVYLVQSGARVPQAPAESSSVGENENDLGTPLANRLYRRHSDGTFEDVTEASRSGHTGYGMGAAVGDIDNDGNVDLFITNLGADALLLNRGDGTFEDISNEAGIGNDGWSMSAAFFDYDRDGFLDLYVTRYVQFDPAVECSQENGRRDYCGPTAFAAEHDLLYRNNGDGTFIDHSSAAGLLGTRYAGLGVVAADLNGDAWLDLYVANDADPNNLWVNNGDGTFEDHATLLGAAVNQQGSSEAGMGIAIGDVDRDSRLDLFVTHLIGESNTLYRQMETGTYSDATAKAGLVSGSLDFTGFGTALLDFDNNGTLDLAIANGAVKRRSRTLTSGDPWASYAEPNLLFLGTVDGRFVDSADACGDLCSNIAASRSLLPADFDQDGGIDLLVTHIEGPVQLLDNRAPRGNWVEFRLPRPALRREAHGAIVATWTDTGCWVSAAVPTGGYLVGGHPRIHLGLGESSRIEQTEVIWPSGQHELFGKSGVNRIVQLREGEGQPASGLEWSQPCA